MDRMKEEGGGHDTERWWGDRKCESKAWKRDKVSESHGEVRRG